MLFSAAAQAKVCFLPDSNCGGVNYGYTDKSGSTCTYKTRDEANRKKGECETVQKQGFCFYLSCSMSKSDCDKAAANAQNHDKCCVPCGNCWKVADCSIPQIPTCTGAGYETEQTCKNQNLNFKPNGKFDKNGTACGTCEDGPTPRPCSYWNTLSQTYMTEAVFDKSDNVVYVYSLQSFGVHSGVEAVHFPHTLPFAMPFEENVSPEAQSAWLWYAVE